MREESPVVLEYRSTVRTPERRPIGIAFVLGWLLGMAIGAVAIAMRLGGVGVLLPILCVGIGVVGMPVFLLVRRLARAGSIGGGAAFIIALAGAMATGLGIFYAAIYSFHGC